MFEFSTEYAYFGKESWGICYGGRVIWLAGGQYLEPLGMNVRIGSNLRAVHRKGIGGRDKRRSRMKRARWEAPSAKKEERNRGLLCNVGFSMFVPFSG